MVLMLLVLQGLPADLEKERPAISITLELRVLVWLKFLGCLLPAWQLPASTVNVWC